MNSDEVWLDAVHETLRGYRNMIDATLDQLSDEQLAARPRPHLNSVAVILRHLGGNLTSRWTNFLTEDGEKPSRDRDREFEDWTGDRDSLLSYFDAGWNRLLDSLDGLTAKEVSNSVKIRGEVHTVPRAIQRTLTHIAYHVGQILLVARLVYDDDDHWNWLTIQPGASRQHNAATWGTTASRGVAGEDRG